MVIWFSCCCFSKNTWSEVQTQSPTMWVSHTHSIWGTRESNSFMFSPPIASAKSCLFFLMFRFPGKQNCSFAPFRIFRCQALPVSFCIIAEARQPGAGSRVTWQNMSHQTYPMMWSNLDLDLMSLKAYLGYLDDFGCGLFVNFNSWMCGQRMAASSLAWPGLASLAWWPSRPGPSGPGAICALQNFQLRTGCTRGTQFWPGSWETRAIPIQTSKNFKRLNNWRKWCKH